MMTKPTDLHASSRVEISAQTTDVQDPYAALTLPENSRIDGASWAALKQHAAEVNLPVPTLEKWAALEEQRLQQLADKQAQAQQQERNLWAAQTRSQCGEAEVARAVRAADVFGGPSLRKLLEETGLGNHPAIVRTFAEVGKRICEDVSVAGAPSAQTDKTFTQALYGKK